MPKLVRRTGKSTGCEISDGAIDAESRTLLVTRKPVRDVCHPNRKIPDTTTAKRAEQKEERIEKYVKVFSWYKVDDSSQSCHPSEGEDEDN